MKDDNVQAEHLWEIHKENTLPLERGRNIKELSKSLATINNKPNNNEEYIQHKRKRFESQLKHFSKNNSSNKDDLLITWLEYIKYIQEEAYPNDTQQTFLLMERCTRSLLKYKQYHQDARFIRVCILYADRTKSPNDLYKYLFEHKVGNETSLFWIAWAWVAEKNDDYKFADKIFSKGIKKGAKPIKVIEMRYKQFQRRMSRHWLNQQNNDDDDDDDDGNGVDVAASRGTLTSLTQDGVRNNQRSRIDNIEYYVDENTGRRIPITNNRHNNNAGNIIGTNSNNSRSNRGGGGHHSSRNNNENNDPGGLGFQIFNDTSLTTERSFLNDSITQDSNNHTTNTATTKHRNRYKLPKQADINKENTIKPQRWNESSLNPTNTTTNNRSTTTQSQQPAPLSFEVFQDPECQENNNNSFSSSAQQQQQKRRHNNNKISNVLSQSKGVSTADKLKNDPLRYVRNPDKLKQDELVKYNNNIKNKQCNQEKEEKQTSTNANNQYGFNKRLLIDKHNNNEETCFEECRAIYNYFALNENKCNFNLLKIDHNDHEDEEQVVDNSIMSISMEEEDDEEDCCYDDTHNQHQKDDHQSFETGLDHSSSSHATNQRNNNHLDLSQSIIHNKQTTTARRNDNNNNNTTTDNINDTSFATTSSIDTKDPTINTKLALRELSFMFISSPVQQHDHSSMQQQQPQNKSLLINKSIINNTSYFEQRKATEQQDNDKSSFSIMEDDFIIHDDDDQNNNSILNNNNNTSAASMLNQEQIDKRAKKTVAFSSFDENNYFPSIKHSNTNENRNVKKKPLGVSFSSSFIQSKSFDIHEEHDDDDDDKKGDCEEDDEITSSNAFSIYNENSHDNNEMKSNDFAIYNENDSSAFGEISPHQPMKELNIFEDDSNENEMNKFDIYNENDSNTFGENSLQQPMNKLNIFEDDINENEMNKFDIYNDAE